MTVAGGQLTQHDLGSLRSNGSGIRRRQLLNLGPRENYFFDYFFDLEEREDNCWKLGVLPPRRTIVQFEEFKGESLFSAALSIMKVSFDDNNTRREQKIPS